MKIVTLSHYDKCRGINLMTFIFTRTMKAATKDKFQCLIIETISFFVQFFQTIIFVQIRSICEKARTKTVLTKARQFLFKFERHFNETVPQILTLIRLHLLTSFMEFNCKDLIEDFDLTKGFLFVRILST
jgi:hypothetical protein